jgi:hypothetical protein
MMLVSASGMGVTALATAVWVARFWTDAPQVAMSHAGLGSVGLSWVIIVVVAMAVATITAGLATWRSWRVRGRQLAVA